MFRLIMKFGPGMSSTVSKIFIDTNVFVYALDKKDQSKQEDARAVLKELAASHHPVISTQILKEFYVVAVSKLKADPFIVKGIVHNLRNMEIVNNDLDLIEQAIDIVILSRISFWDALVVAAAEKAHCEFIYSEDLSSGQTYRGVMVVNPFLKSRA